MQSKKFQRNIEDFECEKCSTLVRGNGYTNHCPACLWSKHVDVHPGDRAHMCGGLMEPVRVETEKDAFLIVHRCTKCALEKRNTMAGLDNFEEALKIARRVA